MNKYIAKKGTSTTIFADHYQFYIQDVDSIDDLSNVWTEESSKNKFTYSKHTVCIGTQRNVDVPVDVSFHNMKPVIHVDSYQHIVESYLELPSGQIAIAGVSNSPQQVGEKVPAGVYSVIVCYSGLVDMGNIDNEPKDKYDVFIFPQEMKCHKVIKHSVY